MTEQNKYSTTPRDYTHVGPMPQTIATGKYLGKVDSTSQLLARDIRNFAWAEDTQESIARFIEWCSILYSFTEERNDIIDFSVGQMNTMFSDVIKELGEDKDYHSLPEISGARRGYDTLAESLQNLSPSMLNPNLGKLTQNHMSDELLSQIAGDAAVNAVPADGSLTTPKFADKAITPDKTTFIKHYKSDNLVDKTKFVKGLLSSTGLLTGGSYDDYYTTAMIPVETGSINFPYLPSLGGGNQIYCYDEDGTYYTRVSGTVSSDETHRTWSFTDANVKSVRFSLPKSAADEVMLTNNQPYPSAFQPFKDEIAFDESLTFNENQYNIINSKIPNDPLANKIVTANGDSIMEGVSNGGGYMRIIGERNNMVVDNRAKGGGTFTAGTLATGGGNRHWVSRDIVNMRSDADFAIIQCGINDSTLEVELGSESENWDGDLDDTTFYGAVESTLKQLILKYKGKKVGVILSHMANSRQLIYYPVIREMCEKWGVPYLDLMKEVPPIRYIPELSTLYTTNNDGVHPTHDGYLLYYADKVEAWMKTL